MAPFPEFAEPFAGGLHFGKDFFGMDEELFARLSERDGFAHSVQKATADLALESLHRVTDCGLGKVEFPGSCSKGASAREGGKSTQLPAVQRFDHI